MTQLQGELGFGADGAEEGYAKWLALRQRAVEAAAQKLNLPLGHPSEVWLRGGIRLRGTLRLAHGILFIEEKRDADLALTLDGVTFRYSEIESCLRLDQSGTLTGQTHLNCRVFLMRAARRDPLHAWARALPGSRRGGQVEYCSIDIQWVTVI